MKNLNRPCYLVVDHNPDSRGLYTFTLEALGAEVIPTSSASEAFEVLTRFRLDVLLCDIFLPEIDGYMLLNKLRKSNVPAWEQLPAIAVTALGGECNYQKVRAAGFQKCIVKPVDLDQLIATVHDLTRLQVCA